MHQVCMELVPALYVLFTPMGSAEYTSRRVSDLTTNAGYLHIKVNDVSLFIKFVLPTE